MRLEYGSTHAVSEITSSHETNWRKRSVASFTSESADSVPIIVVVGARQVGKATMLRNELADYDFSESAWLRLDILSP